MAVVFFGKKQEAATTESRNTVKLCKLRSLESYICSSILPLVFLRAYPGSATSVSKFSREPISFVRDACVVFLTSLRCSTRVLILCVFLFSRFKYKANVETGIAGLDTYVVGNCAGTELFQRLVALHRRNGQEE